MQTYNIVIFKSITIFMTDFIRKLPILYTMLSNDKNTLSNDKNTDLINFN